MTALASRTNLVIGYLTCGVEEQEQSTADPDLWFWIHAAQVVVFAGVAIAVFRRLALLQRFE